MKFEIRESAGEWIVSRDGVEIARLPGQEAALERVTCEMRSISAAGGAVSLAMQYERRTA